MLCRWGYWRPGSTAAGSTAASWPSGGRLFDSGLRARLSCGLLLLDEARPVPAQGFASISEGLPAFLERIALPTFTLSFIYIALFARITRAAMLEVLNEDYIRTAHAKGLKEHVVLVKHALRNAAIPSFR